MYRNQFSCRRCAKNRHGRSCPYRFSVPISSETNAYTLTFAAFFFGGFSTLMPRFFCHHTHRLGTKQMELNVPIAIPAIIGTEKLRMESRPITSATMVTISMELNVVTEVRILRRSDWESLMLTSSWICVPGSSVWF